MPLPHEARRRVEAASAVPPPRRESTRNEENDVGDAPERTRRRSTTTRWVVAGTVVLNLSRTVMTAALRPTRGTEGPSGRRRGPFSSLCRLVAAQSGVGTVSSVPSPFAFAVESSPPPPPPQGTSFLPSGTAAFLSSDNRCSVSVNFLHNGVAMRRDRLIVPPAVGRAGAFGRGTAAQPP